MKHSILFFLTLALLSCQESATVEESQKEKIDTASIIENEIADTSELDDSIIYVPNTGYDKIEKDISKEINDTVKKEESTFDFEKIQFKWFQIKIH